MKWISDKRAVVQVILLLMVASLLPVLAFLQYNWVEQVSEQEATRMKENLEVSANRFSEDFDRELSNINQAFLVNSEKGKVEQRVRNSYLSWKENTSVPALIEHVYLATRTSRGEAGLEKYDFSSQKLVDFQWPAHLLEFKEKFRGYADEMGKGSVNFSTGVITGEEITIFLPQINLREVTEGNGLSGVGYSIVLVQLDTEYIRKQIFPALLKRYFESGGQINYHIQVLDKTDERKVFYSSIPDSNEVFSSYDFSSSFLSMRFKTMFFVSLKDESQNAETSVSIVAGADIKTEIKADEIFYDEKRLELHGDFQFVARNDAEISFGTGGKWELLVKHKLGSLSAAVNERKYLNLFISFGILIALAFSIAILIYNSRKSQKLAKQQMEFVAGVSHELRTPLAVIRSAGENLADDIVSDANRTRQYGQLIEKEGRRLSEMVEKVLLFSRIQSGNLCLNPISLDLNAIIEEALNLCDSALREKNFETVKELHEDLPRISGDHQTLVNIVVNLVSNAVKYSGESTWLGVKSYFQNGEKGEVVFEITDAGLGILPEDQGKIFQSFYRSDYVRHEQIEGTGLGLSLVKKIVTEHGGTISVESTPDQGSTFRVALPALIPQNESEAQDV